MPDPQRLIRQLHLEAVRTVAAGLMVFVFALLIAAPTARASEPLAPESPPPVEQQAGELPEAASGDTSAAELAPAPSPLTSHDQISHDVLDAGPAPADAGTTETTSTVDPQAVAAASESPAEVGPGDPIVAAAAVLTDGTGASEGTGAAPDGAESAGIASESDPVLDATGGDPAGASAVIGEAAQTPSSDPAPASTEIVPDAPATTDEAPVPSISDASASASADADSAATGASAPIESSTGRHTVTTATETDSEEASTTRSSVAETPAEAQVQSAGTAVTTDGGTPWRIGERRREPGAIRPPAAVGGASEARRVPAPIWTRIAGFVDDWLLEVSRLLRLSVAGVPYRAQDFVSPSPASATPEVIEIRGPVVHGAPPIPFGPSVTEPAPILAAIPPDPVFQPQAVSIVPPDEISPAALDSPMPLLVTPAGYPNAGLSRMPSSGRAVVPHPAPGRRSFPSEE